MHINALSLRILTAFRYVFKWHKIHVESLQCHCVTAGKSCKTQKIQKKKNENQNKTEIQKIKKINRVVP